MEKWRNSSMKLFTVGPVQMLDEVKKIGGEQVPYFRTEEFSDLMIDSDQLLRKFMNAGENAKSIYLTASGTGAMEATIMNCLRRDDRVLVINGGTFGSRFVDLCERYDIPYEAIELKNNEALSEKHLMKYENKGITALLVNGNETSTGQLYDIEMLSAFCKRNDAYFIVDAISTFLIDPFDMAKNCIDAVIISSQKGLCIAPGLSIVVLSDRIIKERVKTNNLKTLYFNFNDYLINFQRGQTPYTPCVGICTEMNKALHIIDDMGLDHWLKHIDDVAKDFRNRIKDLPVSIPNFSLGNAVTPIIFKRNIAKKVFNILKDKHGVFVNPTGGNREEYVLRIAHIGATDVKDNEMLVDLLKKTIEEVD